MTGVQVTAATKALNRWAEAIPRDGGEKLLAVVPGGLGGVPSR